MQIPYASGDFNSYLQQLISYAKQNYPTTYTDFDDGAIGQLYFDLIAGIGDNLRFNIARAAQENQLQYAQEAQSLYNFAQTYGLALPNKRPAVTVVNFTVQVPPLRDSFDLTYCPLIVRGAQVLGNGQSYETKYNIDFSSPFSQNGIPNRTIVPNVDSNGRIVSYSISKQELVVAGISKWIRNPQLVGSARPFKEIVLPDSDVLSIENIVVLNGTNYTSTPTLSEQLDPNNKWEYVKNLSQNVIFDALPIVATDRTYTLAGKWKNVTKRYTYQFTPSGSCVVRFGGGIARQNGTTYSPVSANLLANVNTLANEYALGEYPPDNCTIFIQCRVGGGLQSNAPANSIQTLGTMNYVPNGQSPIISQRVRGSLTVDNPIPAIGGADSLSVEELRNIIRYNTSAQERCVTAQDYYAKIMTMDGRFGTPSKVSVAVQNNKVDIAMLGFDANGGYTNQSTNTLKENIAEYLQMYKSMNDYISIRDGKLIHLAFEWDIIISKQYSITQILSSVVDATYNYFSTVEMGQDVYLSNIFQKVNEIGGVLSVSALRVYNKVGNGYSENATGQGLLDTTTRQLDVTSLNVVLANYDELLQILNKNTDIKIRYKQL